MIISMKEFTPQQRRWFKIFVVGIILIAVVITLAFVVSPGSKNGELSDRQKRKILEELAKIEETQTPVTPLTDEEKANILQELETVSETTEPAPVLTDEEKAKILEDLSRIEQN